MHRSLLVLFSLILVTGCTRDRDHDFPDARFGDAGTDAPVEDGDVPPPVVDTCTPEGMGATLGNPCSSPSECDDGCFCNGVEQCEGTCVAGADPCTDAVDCTAESCVEEIDRCVFDPQHDMCSNGDACDGREVCDLRMGCRGASPLYCNDENSCTVDMCNTDEGCVYALRDLDADGYVDGRCGGDDCDDDPRFGTDIYPGAPEACTNRRDDDCNGLRDYNDPVCVPTNDTCASAEVLPGPGTYSGSTASLSANYSLSCVSGTGADAVFRFTLTEMQDVRITISGGGTGVRAALRSFAQCATGPDEKCSAAAPPSILRRSLPPGDYAIIVQTNTGAPFDLSLMFGPPTPIPPVDRCNAGTEDVSAGGTFTGFFAEVDDDYSLTCHTGSSWKDAAYRFTITEPQDVTITASTSGAMWTPTTYVSLVTDCAVPGSTIQCAASSSAMLRRRGLPAGTYYVLIESSATDATMWSLTITITDPVPRLPGDACTTAVDITSAPGSVPLATAEDDGANSCSTTSTLRRDAFFYFDLTTRRDVTLTTTAATSFQYVSLATSCGVTGSEIRCRSSSSPYVQLFRDLAPGRYWVNVTSTSTIGDATAMITTAPPTPVPGNDVCSGAIEVGGAPFTTRTDTLIDFEDDLMGGSCAGTGRPDAFYTITLTTRRRVRVFANPIGSTTSIYLTLRNTCGPGSDIACHAANMATVTATLDPGTYYLMVESPSVTSSYDFNLEVYITAP
jgi:hypothetical protein